MRLIAPVIVLLALLCSCQGPPEFYAPPEQHPPSRESTSVPPDWMFIDMADPGARAHFITDLGTAPSDGWIFTGPSPAIKILTVLTKNLQFRVEFTLWDVAFRKTGPVELQFNVNKFNLAKVRYDSPGPKVFEQPVPAQYLPAGEESLLSVSIDKPWISPRDGHAYGFILQRIGLVSR